MQTRKLFERGRTVELIENLFVAENVTNLETVIYSLRRKIPVLRLYCIVLFEDRNRMEILPSREAFGKRYENRPAKIAGIAMGKREAIDLFCFMVEDALENGRNPADPKELIL